LNALWWEISENESALHNHVIPKSGDFYMLDFRREIFYKFFRCDLDPFASGIFGVSPVVSCHDFSAARNVARHARSRGHPKNCPFTFAACLPVGQTSTLS